MQACDGMDRRWMALALSLGARGLGQTWPNPAVGCVIINNNRVVGRGWTQTGGRPHAERMALDQAGAASAGATVYVTLEPCAHTGKTPPCAQALIDAKVARVVIATDDRDPRVSGKGIAMLGRAGIDVTQGVLEPDARAAHSGFFKRITRSLPHVTLKLAGSFDGRIATPSGQSQWITGPDARHAVHGMRLRHDAVMVGAGTVRADDPSLTVRGFGAAPQPDRIIVSTGLDLPLDSEIARTAHTVPVWILHTARATRSRQEAWIAKGAQLIEYSGNPLLRPALKALADAGLTRIFCEGGATLAASLLREDLVDEMVGFTAGMVLGGDGLAAVAPMGLDTLAQAPRFDLVRQCQVGGDILHMWRRAQTP